LDVIYYTNLPKVDKIRVILFLESLKLVQISAIRGKKITGAFALILRQAQDDARSTQGVKKNAKLNFSMASFIF